MTNPKKLLIILLFTVSISTLAYGQKTYVWAPPVVQNKERTSLKMSDKVYVYFNDARPTSNRTKTDTDAAAIRSRIIEDITGCYPNVEFEIVDDYFDLKPERTSLRITLGSYQAGFGTDVTFGVGAVGGSLTGIVFPKGKWNAITHTYVEIIKDGQKVSKDISSNSSVDNTWGYKSSRKALENTYKDVLNQILVFIDNNIL